MMRVTTASDIAAGPTTMTNRQPASALRRLRILFASGTATGLTDRQLLERFTARRVESSEAASAAEMAFEALVDRHGAMVWGVCRRVLGDAHEAEDAFQATFLVLVRKAGSVRVEDSLGRWLYGVAHRVALRARSGADRRASYRGPTPAGSSDDPAGEVERGELRNALGEEIDRLPTKYRCPIELCDLQGMTYDQASRQLNWSVATVKGRLARGRLKLRERLSRRGLAPVASGVAAALSGEARAAVPRELVHSTIRATTLCATGVSPAAVSALVKGELRTMTLTKLCKVSCAGILLGMAGIVGGTFIPPGDRPRASATTVAGESHAEDSRSDLDRIQGTWIRVSTNGPKAEKIEKIMRMVVKKATDRPDVDVPAGATVFDFDWKFEGAEGTSHNHGLLDPTRNPKTLDFLPEPREVAPKICPGIYKLEGDVLTICGLAIQGERPTRFDADVRGVILDVYNRVKP